MITTSRKTKPTTPAMIHTNLDLNKLDSLVGTRAGKVIFISLIFKSEQVRISRSRRWR